jgi:superfamily II DNA/RNA helicase
MLTLDHLTHTATPLASRPAYQPTHTFEDFSLDKRLVRALQDKGFSQPTAIQDQTIPHILAGKDLIGLANTGTGKTAAFLLPVMHQNLADRRGYTLIVVPTRELATQISQEFRSLAAKLPLQAAVCVGGESMYQQVRSLRNRPDIIIGTPGRLKDLIMRGNILTRACTTLVLDEVDRMLDMGFIDEIRYLENQLPDVRQSLFFSATMTPQIRTLSLSFLTDPVSVSVLTEQTSSHIDQRVEVVASNSDKLPRLTALLNDSEFSRVMIFGATKLMVEQIFTQLDTLGYNVATIHGDRNQMQRTRALAAFKRGDVSILVATDVAARGLDISQVSHVINYDLPRTYDEYIHRIGRTGRAGQSGQAISFVVNRRPSRPHYRTR